MTTFKVKFYRNNKVFDVTYSPARPNESLLSFVERLYSNPHYDLIPYSRFIIDVVDKQDQRLIARIEQWTGSVE